MNKIPIFDCLTHPTINGDWILPDYIQKSKMDDLLTNLESNNICNAFAVGMQTIGGYDEAKYCKYIVSKSDKLLPVAFFNVNEQKNISSVKLKLKYLKSIKYRGIKLHPRLGNFNLLHPLIPGIIQTANDENLIVLLCTYFYNCSENALYNNIENLLRLLIKIPNEKVILLHSGSVRLLEMIEIARAFRNVLLDLSFTMLKYNGSSLENDIQFAFKNFDRRICIGSDFPQFTISEMRKRFELFAREIDCEKASNIAHNNLHNFLT